MNICTVTSSPQVLLESIGHAARVRHDVEMLELPKVLDKDRFLYAAGP